MRRYHKRPSRRRLKRHFVRYRPVALEDLYNRDLILFVKRHKWELVGPAMVRRYLEPIRMVLEEYSEANLRMALLGRQEQHDQHCYLSGASQGYPFRIRSLGPGGWTLADENGMMHARWRSEITRWFRTGYDVGTWPDAQD